MNSDLLTFSQFKLERILNLSEEHKGAVCLASASSGQKALIFISKAAFKEETIQQLFQEGEIVKLHEVLQHNDKFFNFLAQCAPEFNPLFIKFIFPATQADIQKYTPVASIVIRETPDIYTNFTYPFIKSRSTEELIWLWNILDGKAEQDRILDRESDGQNGFVIIPDIKWDEQNMDGLYVLGIVERRDLQTLRDLCAEDIPLLQNMMERGLSAIEKHYSVSRSHILCYIHYIPSFMQLHIHLVGTGRRDFLAPRSILVDDIIENLKRDSSFYKDRAIMNLVLPENHMIVTQLDQKQHEKI